MQFGFEEIVNMSRQRLITARCVSS
jgi:hypothetical protein